MRLSSCITYLPDDLARLASLLLVLLLSACGGGGGSSSAPSVTPPPAPLTYAIGGSVSGLQGTLVISNNSEQLSLSTNGQFSFPGKLSSGSGYQVQIVQHPDDQRCLVNNGSGTVASLNVTSVQISCVSYHRIGGSVSGLQGTVEITLNEEEQLALTQDGPFEFSTTILSQHSYRVEITAQPADQVCTISNAEGTVDDQDITDIIIGCGQPVSLSGTITSTARTAVDSDVNDPLSTYRDNGFFETAQALSNFVTLNGFASAEGTNEIGDNFQTDLDEFDVFLVYLQAGQQIRLQVVDFNGIDSYQGDLDLALYDQDQNLIDTSLSQTEFETLIVPEAGDYYVVVSAYSGISKYVLRFPPELIPQEATLAKKDFAPGQAIIQLREGFSADALNSPRALNRHPLKLSNQDHTRSALARFELDSTGNSPRALTSPTFRSELERANPGAFAKLMTLEMIKDLNSQSAVAFAEPNYKRYAHKVPNDPSYNLQWHYPAINLPQAWELTTGDSNDQEIIVAVVDTGVYLDHPDLRDQLNSGYDFISNAASAGDGDGLDPNPDDPGDGTFLSSSSWHGTHVAGTIAASSDNSQGVAGIAWQARIMPIRVLGTEGGTSYDVIQGVRFAAGLENDSGTVAHTPADIINLSLGGGGRSQAEQATYTQVRQAGITVVASAGNENTSAPFYPAAYDDVISVAASDFFANRAPYSNFGPTIDIAAPGGDMRFDANQDGYPDGILSTLVDSRGNQRVPVLAFYEGTSMAAPHVAGVIALMKSVYPALSPEEVQALLENGNLTDNPTGGRDDQLGYGVIDAFKAVDAAQHLALGGALPPTPAILTSAPASLIFEIDEIEAEIIVSNQGSELTSVTSILSSADWLTVTAVGADSQGLGTYQVTVDRTGLNDVLYTARLIIRSATGSETIVPVSMLAGDDSTGGETSAVYVILMDDQQAEITSVVATQVTPGVFSYEFNNVISGDYFLAGGSDVDNDYYLCQYGESCGGFPVLNNFELVSVTDESRSGLDFVVDILFSRDLTESQASNRSQTGSPSTAPPILLRGSGN